MPLVFDDQDFHKPRTSRKRELDNESRAVACAPTLGPDLAAVFGEDCFYDRQAKTCPFRFVAVFTRGPVKPFKYTLQILRRDAHAVVLYQDVDVVVQARHPCSDRNSWFA